jgi:hypothetical protein
LPVLSVPDLQSGYAAVPAVSTPADDADDNPAGLHLSADQREDLRERDLPAEKPSVCSGPACVNILPTDGIEARRWTVVFHRRAENRFFHLIALGHFKHVSAFAFVPEIGAWVVYDVGFRLTRLTFLADTDVAKTILAQRIKGNCTVTLKVREDNLPWFRPGLLCTTAVAHLVGVKTSALRPDRLFRHLVAAGGVVQDDGIVHPKDREAEDRREPEPCG